MDHLLEYYRQRAATLESAIREHRDQRGDDRCWLDDQTLYEALGDIPAEASLKLPPKEEFLSNCARYWECRQFPLDKYVAVSEVKHLTRDIELARGHIARLVAERDTARANALSEAAKLIEDRCHLPKRIEGCRCYVCEEDGWCQGAIDAACEIRNQNVEMIRKFA